jgi:hypothetical protein
MKLIIYDSFSNHLEMSYELEKIAKLIEQGFTSGFEPAWEIQSEVDDKEFEDD